MSRHTSMATGGHCAVPQSALYEHGLLVGVVFGPERASSPCCQAASARGGHSDELGELLWAGDVADGDTEPPGNSRPPSGRPRTRPGHPPRGGRDRGRPDAGMLPQWRARVGPSQRIAGTHSATESSANTSASGSPPDPAPMRIPDRQHPASRMQRGITVRLSDCPLSGDAESLGPDAGLIAGDIQRGGPAEAG